MDKYIEVTDAHYITSKQTLQVYMIMHNDHEKLFIATIYNVIFAPALSNRLFYIIALMDFGHTCLLHKVF